MDPTNGAGFRTSYPNELVCSKIFYILGTQFILPLLSFPSEPLILLSSKVSAQLNFLANAKNQCQVSLFSILPLAFVRRIATAELFVSSCTAIKSVPCSPHLTGAKPRSQKKKRTGSALSEPSSSGQRLCSITSSCLRIQLQPA